MLARTFPRVRHLNRCVHQEPPPKRAADNANNMTDAGGRDDECDHEEAGLAAGGSATGGTANARPQRRQKNN